jgi:hypothetical protein
LHPLLNSYIDSSISTRNKFVVCSQGDVVVIDLSHEPDRISIDSTIDWAKQRGNKYINLGGGLGGSKDSLYHFKAGFSDLSKPFVTLKTIVDNDIYDRLTCLRAESLGMTLPEIKDESFFPVYRLN